MDGFNEMLEKRDYDALITCCEDMLKGLCSGIENSDYPRITIILDRATSGCYNILEMADAIDIGDEKLKLFAEYIKNNLQSQDKTEREIFTVGDVDEIKRVLAEYWIYSSVYSFMYAIYNIGEYLKKNIVYNPDLINEMQPHEAWCLYEIYRKGHITKDEIDEDMLDRFANDEHKELKLCSIDEKGRVFLTNMGITFIRRDEDRIMGKMSVDKVRPFELQLRRIKFVGTAVPPPRTVSSLAPLFNEEGADEIVFGIIREQNISHTSGYGDDMSEW